MDAERKRKAHKKSRRGCRNCKLRRVKCDEGQPKCLKCTDYGVSCNYGDSKAPDLQVSFQGSTAPVLNVTKVPKAPSAIAPMVMDNFQPSSFQLDRQMLDRLGRFKTRTVLSMGNPDMVKLYQKEAVELAFQAPYLMHIVQTITMLHDSYLGGNASSKTMLAEICYHWSQGVSMFNQKLSSPILDHDRDPLCSAAALSCVVAFAAVEATEPEDAWPLKPADDSDLDWLKMNDGKKTVFSLTNPMRLDSIFHSFLKNNFAGQKPHGTHKIRGIGAGVGGPLIPSGIEQLPPQFIYLYDIEKNPDIPDPYYSTLCILGRLLPMECSQKTVLHFMAFLTDIDLGFRYLLEIKDHRALLILAFWYAKVCKTSNWWMDRRATVECQSICLYLQRYSTDLTILELLEFPQTKCGLGLSIVDSLDESPLGGFSEMQDCLSIVESH